MNREAVLHWILILCSKTLFIRFDRLEMTVEEPTILVGGEAWPGGDVESVFTRQLTPSGPADASAA